MNATAVSASTYATHACARITLKSVSRTRVSLFDTSSSSASGNSAGSTTVAPSALITSSDALNAATMFWSPGMNSRGTPRRTPRSASRRSAAV